VGSISNTHITRKLRIYYFKEAITMTFDRIIELLKSDDYKSRAIGEYYFVKDKYNKLHSMIIKREAGKLDFEPNCPMEQWKSQASAMGQYLYQLEIKAEIEGYSLDVE
jgi:hypothetical protein